MTDDPDDFSGPEWIDDPNQRLIALMQRGTSDAQDRAAQEEAKRLGFRDLCWRPYLRAGAPYGEDEAGAQRWYQEQRAASVEPEPTGCARPFPHDLPLADPTYAGIPMVGLSIGYQPLVSGFAIAQIRAEMALRQRVLEQQQAVMWQEIAQAQLAADAIRNEPWYREYITQVIKGRLGSSIDTSAAHGVA